MVTSARYCDLVRERRDTYNHRLRLVESAKQRGIKPTARLFTTSPLTVRKGWRRYPQHGPSGLQEHSRAPHGHPLKTGQVPATANLRCGAPQTRVRPAHQPQCHAADLARARPAETTKEKISTQARSRVQQSAVGLIQAEQRRYQGSCRHPPLRAAGAAVSLTRHPITPREVRSGLWFWAFAEKRSAAASLAGKPSWRCFRYWLFRCWSVGS